MLRDANRGQFQLILTKEVSRFSRNILDTILYTRELKAVGVSVLFLTENIDTSDPKSEMLLSFMATLAQEESRKTGSRVTWGQQRQMEKGIVFGRSLLGYDVIGGKLFLEPEGAELVRLIFHKYAIERMSTSKLSKYLEGEGYRTSTGNPKWSESHIIKILKNEKYMGDLIQRKSYTPNYLTHQKKTNHGEVPLITLHNHHEPIIDRALWELAQDRLRKNNKHNYTTTGHSNRYLFSGKIKCGICGASFVSRKRKLQNGQMLQYWCCATAVTHGKSRCEIGYTLRDDDARSMLKTAIFSLKIDINKILQNIAGLAWKGIHTSGSEILKDTGHLTEQIDIISQKKERMMDTYFSGDISKEEMLALKKRYDNAILKLQNSRNSANTQYVESISKSDILCTLEAVFYGKTESELFYKTILDHITACKDRQVEVALLNLHNTFLFSDSESQTIPQNTKKD